MSRELDAKVAEKVFGWHIFRVGYEDTEEETPEQKKYQAELERGDFSDIGWYAFIPSSKEVVLWEDDWHKLYQFTTDASMDYSVLKHVRETWGQELADRFCMELEEILSARFAKARNLCMFSEQYEPGDYSKAALKALGEEI